MDTSKPKPTFAQERTLERIVRRYGLLSLVTRRCGDVHAQVVGTHHAWVIAPDGRAVRTSKTQEDSED